MFDPTKYTKSRFVKGADLPRRGVAVTVSKCYEHTFSETGEIKPALDFADFDQGMVLNKSQVLSMIELFGTDVRLWVGQRINLIPVPSNYQGKPTILITQAEGELPPRQQYTREDYAASGTRQPEPPDDWPVTPPPARDSVTPF